MADETSIAVEANKVRKLTGGIWRGITGKNVIIGVIDSGIQYNSKSFKTSLGASRILFIYDQTQTRTNNPGAVHADGATEPNVDVNFVLNPPFTVNRGVEYDEHNNNVITNAIRNKKSLKHSDSEGHGTITASIAASNGFQIDHCSRFYSGIAPEADIIAVKVKQGSTQDDVLDAICYLILKAKELGKAMVINLSISFNSEGFHDGSAPLEKQIDHLLQNSPTGKGLSIVTIAGNFRDQKMHVRGSVAGTGSVKIHFKASKSFPTKRFRVWCEIGNKNPVKFKIIAPNGNDTGELSNPLPVHQTNTGQGGKIGAVSEIAASFQIIRIEVIVPMIALDLAFFDDKDSTFTKSWQIELTNPDNPDPINFHIWSDSNDLVFSDLLDENATVTIPGTAKRVITVGAHHFGGGIASFSGRGTTVTGEIKPEITAPGVNVIGIDNDLPGWCEDTCCCCCNVFHTTDKPGTSLSAPIVAGAIALLLDLKPNLTNDEIRDILFRNITIDSHTTNLPNTLWGHGKLDVKKAVDEVNNSLTPPRPLAIVAIADPFESPVISAAELAGFNSGLEKMKEEFMESQGGKIFYSLAQKHADEVMRLINHNKRVATVWHRSDGPLMLRLFGRLLMKPDKPLPSIVNGRAVRDRLMNVASIVKRFASPALGYDIDKQLPVLLQMEGKSVHQIMDYLKTGNQ